MQTVSADAAIARRLFEPVRLGSLELANRIAMAPMSRYLCPDGIPHEGVAAYYARRAAAGVGLIITEGTYIGHPSAASYDGVPHFHGEALEGWSRVVEAVHAAGGKIFPQLWHTGSFRQSWMGPIKGVPGFGPSENVNAFTNHPEPTQAMSESDIGEVIAAYAQAAADAQRLGFDGVELHGAHGYLIDEFLWGHTNRRADRWGGDRRERTRFAVEVLAAVRRRVGPDFPVSLRWSLWKQQDYQAKLADNSRELAEILEPLVDAGASILHPSTRRFWGPGFPDEDGDLTLAGWTRKISGLPVIMVGGAGLDRAGIDVVTQVASLEVLERPLAAGEFDVLAVGRALLADPDWALKVREGRMAERRAYSKDLLDRLD